MGTTLLSAIFATLLNLSTPALQADTIHTYIVDGVQSERPDFSVMLGKKIVFYMSKPEKTESGTVCIKHIVQTASLDAPNHAAVTLSSKDKSKPVTIVQSGNDIQEIFYYVNDKQISREEFQKLNSSDVQSVTVLNGEAAKKITGKDKTGAVIVTLKVHGAATLKEK